MAETQRGRAVVWSIGGITYTGGIVSSTADRFIQSVRVSRQSEKANIKDDGGTIRTQIFHGFTKTLSLTVVPAATSGANTEANAQASADSHCPAPGTVVAIADDSGTIIDDNYNVISATQNRTVDGVATIDLELEAGDEGVEIATAIS